MRLPILILACAASLTAQPAGEWPSYLRDPGGMRYSPLRQVNRRNAARLKVAWTFRTAALEPQTPLNRKAAFEATPLMLDGRLIFPTPFGQVFALEPETGRELWSFDPEVEMIELGRVMRMAVRDRSAARTREEQDRARAHLHR